MLNLELINYLVSKNFILDNESFEHICYTNKHISIIIHKNADVFRVFLDNICQFSCKTSKFKVNTFTLLLYLLFNYDNTF